MECTTAARVGWRVVSDPRVEIEAVCVLPPHRRAGRRSNPDGLPPRGVLGGQPVPAAVADISSLACPVLGLPRWARCPLDQHVHLLTPEEVAAPGSQGHGYSGCGQGIPAVGLRLVGSKAGTCLGWIVVVTGSAR